MFRVEVHIAQAAPPTHADLNAALDIIESDVVCLDSHVFGGRQMRNKEPTSGTQTIQFTTAEVSDTAYETYVTFKQIEDHLLPLFPTAKLTMRWFDEDAEEASFRWDTGDEKPDEPEEDDADE